MSSIRKISENSGTLRQVSLKDSGSVFKYMCRETDTEFTQTHSFDLKKLLNLTKQKHS